VRYTLLDGSPRQRSNTGILLAAVARGLEATGHTVEIAHLARPFDRARAPELFAAAERVILGFPLYTDAMPGLVKELVEALEPRQGRPNPPLAFLVQSGTPEAGQSRAVVRYLELLATRLGAPYLGCIVKGQMEGIQERPPATTQGLLARFEAMGRTLGRTGRLDSRELRALAGLDWPGPLWRLGARLILASAGKRFWDTRLKKNGTYERRFDQPYRA
jgi:NAD(P)H-dependent FMN reductase